jgi:dephospho-CoA kinase
MILGITGKAGSGKSYISKLIKKIYKNTHIIDVDKIGHKVLELAIIKSRLSVIFGKEIFDENKKIDRKKLAEIVFSSEDKLKQLNSIVHSEIFNMIEKHLEKNKKKYDIIIIDAAILHEIKLDKLCDKIMLVEADEYVRLNRLTENRNIDSEKAKAIIKSQQYLTVKDFDFMINTNSSEKKIFIDAIRNFFQFL